MKITTTFILLIVSFLSTYANTYPPAIDGFWQNDQFKVVIEVQTTEYGFKAIRTDAERWYRYNWAYDNVYTDRDGNRYIVYDDYSMAWEANDGRRLDFHKLEKRGTYEPLRDTYSTVNLGGSWTDFRQDAQLRIIPEGGGFKARIWNGEWRYYDRIDRDYFEDRFGNSFTRLRDGRLKYEDRRSRRVYFFEQQSTRY